MIEGPTRCARLWTSSLLRTIQTAALIPHPIVRGPDGTPNAWEEMSPRVYRNIDEIFAGDCEGLTPEEMEKAHPQTATLRKTDKIGFRYPRGESYFDLISRLEPCIQEMESYAEPLLIVSHQAILRLIFAYLTGVDREKAPLMLDAIHQNVVYQIDLDASSESHITGDAETLPKFVKVWDFREEVERRGSRRRGGRGRRGRGGGGRDGVNIYAPKEPGGETMRVEIPSRGWDEYEYVLIFFITACEDSSSKVLPFARRAFHRGLGSRRVARSSVQTDELGFESKPLRRARARFYSKAWTARATPRLFSLPEARRHRSARERTARNHRLGSSRTAPAASPGSRASRGRRGSRGGACRHRRPRGRLRRVVRVIGGAFRSVAVPSRLLVRARGAAPSPGRARRERDRARTRSEAPWTFNKVNHRRRRAARSHAASREEEGRARPPRSRAMRACEVVALRHGTKTV